MMTATPTEICFMPDGWPAGEVTNTLRLKGAVKLGLPELHSEDVDAGKRGDQGDEPGCTNKTVGRPRDCEWSCDGTVPVQGDRYQHVV